MRLLFLVEGEKALTDLLLNENGHIIYDDERMKENLHCGDVRVDKNVCCLSSLFPNVTICVPHLHTYRSPRFSPFPYNYLEIPT